MQLVSDKKMMILYSQLKSNVILVFVEYLQFLLLLLLSPPFPSYFREG